MSTASAVEDAAASVAADLLEEGLIAIPRSAANRRVKEAGEFDAITHDAIEAGFGTEGWAYARHLYFHPEEVAERAGAAAEAFEGDGRLLVAHSEVRERIAGEADDGGEAGWTEGAFAETVREVFRDRGWDVGTVERGSIDRTFYYRSAGDHPPLEELFAEHHPNGQYPLSTDELVSQYRDWTCGDRT